MKARWRIVIVIIGTIGIVSLLIDNIQITNFDAPLKSLSIFKYFTVQSNLMAISYFWFAFGLKLDTKSQVFKNLVGGVMFYTTITFLVYFFVLESLYVEKGWGLVGSICLHYVNPLLIIGYILYFKTEYVFCLKDVFIWIIYPILYLLFLIVWGVFTGDYIYPFFQVSEIGVISFILNISGMVTLFTMLSFFAVKILSKK